jgi:hypothetical protein
MRIHAFEGLAPGKGRKAGNIDARRHLSEQNAGLRTSIIFPVTVNDRTLTPKKVKGIILKHFGHKSLTLQKLSGGENK